jgi:anti-sigma regulatory factor (Ser/Thr protein kinase)
VLRRDHCLIRNTPAAPAVARRYVGETLASAPRDLVDVAALMVSELATNCVRYAHSDFTVSIEQTGREVRVDVADEGRGEVAMRDPVPTEPDGRGLRIVDQLADAWGVRAPAERTGNSVWFVLRL